MLAGPKPAACHSCGGRGATRPPAARRRFPRPSRRVPPPRDDKVEDREDRCGMEEDSHAPAVPRAAREGTEYAFTGAYWNNHAAGAYRCAACGLELFSSDDQVRVRNGVAELLGADCQESRRGALDGSLGMGRVEVLCAAAAATSAMCSMTGPKPTGLRYCMNSAALSFALKSAASASGGSASAFSQGIPPASIGASFAGSMLPPETTHTSFPRRLCRRARRRPSAAPAPSAIDAVALGERAGSRSATSASDTTSEPSSSAARERPHLVEHALRADAVHEARRVVDRRAAARGERRRRAAPRSPPRRPSTRTSGASARSAGGDAARSGRRRRTGPRSRPRPGGSSRISRPIVPLPAITAGSLTGWMKRPVEPVVAMLRSITCHQRSNGTATTVRAEPLDRGELGAQARGRARPPSHGTPSAPRVPRHALRHVAGARRVDAAARARRGGSSAMAFRGAADLERADRLQVLELEPDLRRAIGRLEHARAACASRTPWMRARAPRGCRRAAAPQACSGRNSPSGATDADALGGSALHDVDARRRRSSIGDAERLEERDLAWRVAGPARCREQHVAQLAHDVVLVDRAFLDRDQYVARLGETPTRGDRRRGATARRRRCRARAVSAKLAPTALMCAPGAIHAPSQHRLRRRGGGADQVRAFDGRCGRCRLPPP